jgi:glycogen debranching enzyme
VAPIALVEVQAYVYLAKTLIADLYRRAGDPERAQRLEAEALELRRHFNRDFWLKDRQCYALALQAGDRPADVLTTNGGHALWGGIADAEKARKTAQRLMAEDMFTGWGMRTLSEKEVGYNPIGYHLGTVWPHDNSIVAAGFRRYGFAQAACDVFSGMIRAAMNFPDYRLPELFAGYSKKDYGVPVPYPLANKPQAWAAGAIPYMLQVLLGLEAEAFEHRLRVVRPVLPEFISWVELHRVPVAQGRVGLRFERTASGVAVEVLGKSGRVDVVVEL